MNDDNNNIITINKLEKVYKTGNTFLTILNRLNLTVKRGETIAIVGRSGSGKSTLLNLIGGLAKPTSGSIVIGTRHIENSTEEELSEFRNSSIGFIFQFHHLLSEFTVIENVMMPYLISRFNRDRAYKKSIELLKILGIYEKREYRPSKLSGGESQRVAIARALINNPEIILADEPTGNLDLKTADDIKELLFTVTKRLGRTMIIVTHNRSISEMADITYVLNYGILNDLLTNSL